MGEVIDLKTLRALKTAHVELKRELRDDYQMILLDRLSTLAGQFEDLIQTHALIEGNADLLAKADAIANLLGDLYQDVGNI